MQRLYYEERLGRVFFSISMGTFFTETLSIDFSGGVLFESHGYSFFLTISVQIPGVSHKHQESRHETTMILCIYTIFASHHRPHTLPNIDNLFIFRRTSVIKKEVHVFSHSWCRDGIIQSDIKGPFLKIELVTVDTFETPCLQAIRLTGFR